MLQSTPLVWKVGAAPKVGGKKPDHADDFPLIGHIEKSVTGQNATVASKIKILKIDFQYGCFDAAEDKIYVRPPLSENMWGVKQQKYPLLRGPAERLVGRYCSCLSCTLKIGGPTFLLTLLRSCRSEIPRRARLLIKKMPEIFERLQNLKSLTVISPSSISIYGQRGDEYAPTLDLALISSLAESIAGSVRTTNFEYLTELKLSLPCSENFLAISKALPERLAHQIKKLFLAYTDATGPGGSNSYLIHSSETRDNDDNYPPSNLQEEYPNRDYAYAMFDIVSQCPNLQVLGLAGTHFLDGNLLDWKSKASGLESLIISRMEITVKNMINLLSPPAHQPTMDSSILTNIELEWVYLTDGLWEEVFRHLYTHCPKLAYFNPKNLSYSRHGRSSHLSMSPLPISSSY